MDAVVGTYNIVSVSPYEPEQMFISVQSWGDANLELRLEVMYQGLAILGSLRLDRVGIFAQ